MYSCHLFLNSSPSVRYILFLSFIVPIFAWNIPLISLNFLEESAAAAAKSLQLCPTVPPHRWQPTRLLRLWDSPGKNTGVGCHFHLQSFPLGCFPLFLCIDHWGRLSYLSLLFFGTLHSNGNYLSSSPVPFTSLLFPAICNTSSDNHFAFLRFFFLGKVLIIASCTMSWTTVHSSSGTLSIRSNHLNLFLTSSV